MNTQRYPKIGPGLALLAAFTLIACNPHPAVRGSVGKSAASSPARNADLTTDPKAACVASRAMVERFLENEGLATLLRVVRTREHEVDPSDRIYSLFPGQPTSGASCFIDITWVDQSISRPDPGSINLAVLEFGDETSASVYECGDQITSDLDNFSAGARERAAQILLRGVHMTTCRGSENVGGATLWVEVQGRVAFVGHSTFNDESLQRAYELSSSDLLITWVDELLK